MWTTLAMTAALALAPAQGGELTLSNIRPTHGLYGPTRKDADALKLLPGDVILISFDIEGLKVAADGKVEYSMGMELTSNKDNKVLYKKEPENLEAYNALGGNRIPAFAAAEIGTDTPAGEYTLTATLTDRAGKASKKFSKKFEVLPKGFGLVRPQLTYDDRGLMPAAPVAVPGQTLFVNAFAIGFERDKKTKQPHIEAVLRILENGKSTLDKDLTGSVNKDFPEDASLMPLTFRVLLNRTGKFTVELKVTDKLAEKSSTLKFDINVVDVPK